MKKMKKGVAFLMAAAMSVSMFACASETSTVSADEGYAYMAIDINPTVELVIKDGNYQLPQYQQPTSVTKDEIIATLRVLANVIEKGAT